MLSRTGLSCGLAALGLALTLSPVRADPAIGIGISVAFGGGYGTQTGLGIRLFSDDEEDSFVGAIGLDYQFQAQSWRPTIGAAWLGDNIFVGLDLGYAFNGAGFDYGMSLGGVDTKKDDPPAPAAEEPEVPGEGNPPV